MERKRRYIAMALAALLCLVTVLWGCQRSTTVILPPEPLPTTGSSSKDSSTGLPDASTAQPTTLPTSAPTAAPTTEPTAAPTTEPTTVPTTEPSTVPPTEPPTVPPTEPPTVPPTEPPTVPPTEPPTVPPTEPPTVPPTEPPTVPSTEPPTVPPTEPPTVPPTEPPTVPPTEPPTVPPTEPPTVPPTEPPTVPPTEPPTVPPTEPPTVPPTEPPTVPPTEPPTVPPTEPEPTQNGVYDISDHTIGSLEYSLLDALNGQRDHEQLSALTMDPTLCALAAIRAYECTEEFSHTRPDGRSAYTVLSDYDYNIWSQVDEQLHWGSGDFSTAVIIRVWMNKDAFASSILSGNYTRIGIGVYTYGGNTYIACLFAG